MTNLVAGWAFAVLVGDVFFNEPELYRRASVTKFFTHFAVHMTAVAPVQVLGVGAKDFEARDRIIGFLGDVVQFWSSVFETSWWMPICYAT